jgi:hypothetical protein
MKIDGWTAAEQLIEMAENKLETAERDGPDGAQAALDAFALMVDGYRMVCVQAIADRDFVSLAELTAELINLLDELGKLLK